MLEQIFAGAPAHHWIDVLGAADVPVSPVNDIREALADPQVVHRDVTMTMTDAHLGDVPGLRYPIRMSATPVETYAAPPELGADTYDVLGSLLGLGRDELADLGAAGVI